MRRYVPSAILVLLPLLSACEPERRPRSVGKVSTKNVAMAKEPEKPKRPLPYASPIPPSWNEPQPKAERFFVRCTYRFHHVAKRDELDLILKTIRNHALDGRVAEHSGQDRAGSFHEFRFSVSSIREIVKLDSTLPFSTTRVEESTDPVYEHFDAQYFTSYRTVTITGSIEVVVRFKITPGASLFYSLGGNEVPVQASSIDPYGSVTLNIRIPRNQQYVYGRTVLGEVERYLRINVETGQPEGIDRAAYQNRR